MLRGSWHPSAPSSVYFGICAPGGDDDVRLLRRRGSEPHPAQQPAGEGDSCRRKPAIASRGLLTIGVSMGSDGRDGSAAMARWSSAVVCHGEVLGAPSLTGVWPQSPPRFGNTPVSSVETVRRSWAGLFDFRATTSTLGDRFSNGGGGCQGGGAQHWVDGGDRF